MCLSQGGLVQPGTGNNGLILGDTVGRTPGAYGFVVSCDLTGYLGPADTVLGATLVLNRGVSQGINPLSSDWTSSAGPGPAKLNVDMSYCFGTSVFLQASDYQATALLPAAYTSYTLTSTAMSIALNPAAVAALNASDRAQFRVTLDPGSYTNWNGACGERCGLWAVWAVRGAGCAWCGLCVVCVVWEVWVVSCVGLLGMLPVLGGMCSELHVV